jgi:hypothetical protein
VLNSFLSATHYFLFQIDLFELRINKTTVLTDSLTERHNIHEFAILQNIIVYLSYWIVSNFSQLKFKKEMNSGHFISRQHTHMDIANRNDNAKALRARSKDNNCCGADVIVTLTTVILS